MTYVDLCFSCSDDWIAAGLVSPPISIDPDGQRSTCMHCGRKKACITHEYIGKFLINSPKNQAIKKEDEANATR